MHASLRIHVHLVGLLLACLSVLSCADSGAPGLSAEGERSEEASSDAKQLAAGSSSFLEQVRDAPFVVNYRGLRRVRLNYLHSTPVDYIEEVGSDGAGQFGIEPLRVIGAHPNAELVLALKSAQRIFDYRYRDFRVLDPALFDGNYAWEMDPQVVEVLDRDCFHMKVSRLPPFDGGHYEADVDIKTGLVLQWKEIGGAGLVRAHVAFESLEFDADLDGLELTSGSLMATELDISGDLSQYTNFHVLTPSLLPTGYQLASATLLQPNPNGGNSNPDDMWVRQLFTDGLQTAWLLHGPQLQAAGGNLGSDRVHIYSDGAWTIAAGEFDGYQVMAVGHVPEDQLLDLLRSSR